MGIYDRDYYRQGRSGFRLSAPRSAVSAIVLLNVLVFVGEIATPVDRHLLRQSTGSSIADLLSAQDDTLFRPWMWWQFLTYGFLHDPGQMGHIVSNMLVLFFLGRDVEDWYGTREFIRLYLVMLVFSSLVWAVTSQLSHSPGVLLGASGAISGVVVLYALNFPKRILLLMFVLPVPAWLLGALVIAYDIMGAMGRGEPMVAYTAHLGGAAFALAYYYFRWNFGRMLTLAGTWLKGRSRPSLKVFKPDDEPQAGVAEEDVDRILEKIHREGEHSLTRKERRILETASREYQRRRRLD